MKAQPWLAPPPAAEFSEDFVVLGAGIAGAAAARALAERGCTVRIVDTLPPASAASGNPAAVLRPVLARCPDDPSARFYTDAFDATKAKITELVAQGHSIAHAFEGALHCHPEPDALRGRASHETWDISQAQAHLGAGAKAGGAWLPDAGWVSPVDYTHALLAHPRIELIRGELASLEDGGLGWRLIGVDGSTLTVAQNVVLANGWQMTQLPFTQPLPINPVASQLLHFQGEHVGDGPVAPVVGSGTISPTASGWFATAGHWHDTTESSVDPERNAEILQRSGGNWQMPEHVGDATVRAAVRATSRDYLPMVGGVPDDAEAREIYWDLSEGRATHHYPEPPYYPGLYLLGALGGRGITSAQFCAEVLLANVFGEEHPWLQGLNPMRFLARELRRGPSGG